MNNITFGDENFGYYETNTRLTDLEILERRYPVILNQSSLVAGTGGGGQYRGGDGRWEV